MTNKIGIEVDGQINTSAIESGLNSLGQKIAAANKVQFQPFSKTTVADVERVVRSFDQLRKINGDLNKRMKDTGQSGAGLLDTDWNKLYPDEHSRARQMRKAFEYSTGRPFVPPPGQKPSPSPDEPPPNPKPKRPPGPTWGGIAGQVAQSGLRAAGPAGGVAAGAVGTGMASGVGAGLMGLMGGMLALGVGKIVGSIADKIEQAEANNVALDRLKRTLGDVNVSFNALKSVVHSGADNLKITYDEAGKLATQFTKLGNVKGDQYGSLADELSVGVGMSRSFGLDPSQGVGVMGQMRGVGVTSSVQDSRRFALLIGETIGRSGAFAKADEVMDAIAGYATSQTRQNMSAANTEGYAGTYSALVGSGVPGLDPAGAGALLARVNASLSAGGAKGEASQFFTGGIGADMGLNPFQTRMLREQGAFATADDAFGENSAYAAFKGLKSGDARPSGKGTLLQGTLDKLRKQYEEGSDELADATANHLGVGINQAMRLLSIKPNQMGELSKYADLTKLSGSGIGNLSLAKFGTADQRKGIADSLLSRKEVSSGDKGLIRDAMAGNGANGSEEGQRELLARLTAQYDQERTIGSDIRDSKAVLDNIKTDLADSVVPYLNEMRMGIMYMAGRDGKTSPQEIMKKMVELESKDRVSAIKGDFAAKKDDARGEVLSFGKLIDAQRDDFQRTGKNLTPEMKAARQEHLTALENEQREKMTALRDRIQKLSEDEAKAIAVENEERDKRIKAIKSGLAGTSADGVAGKVVPASLVGAGAAGAGAGLPPQAGGAAPPTSVGGGGSTGAQPAAGALPSAVGGGGQSGASAPSGAAPNRATTGGSGAQGGSSSAAGGDVPKNKQAAVDQSMKFFMEKGWSKEQAAGITANLVAESGMRTGAVGDGGRAYGVAQWHPDRQREFAKWSGKDIREASLQEQLGFVHYEKTQGREKAAGDRLKNTSTAQQAGSVVSQYYERPADRYGEASKRANMAAKIAAGYKEPKQQASETPKTGAAPVAQAAPAAPPETPGAAPFGKLVPLGDSANSTPMFTKDALGGPERNVGTAMPDHDIGAARKSAEQMHRIQDGKLTVEVLNGQTKKPLAPPQDIAVKVDRARPSSLFNP